MAIIVVGAIVLVFYYVIPARLAADGRPLAPAISTRTN
jgi:hypothetical protein